MIVLNKVDRLESPSAVRLPDRPALCVSARRGDGVEALRAALRTQVLDLPGIEVLRFALEGGQALQVALSTEVVLARRFSDQGIEIIVRRR